jgi:segregation and condensation protein B
MSLKAQLEALLFATDQPLTPSRLQEVLPEVGRAEISAALAELERELEESGRAIRVQRVAGGYQLSTRPEHAGVVRRLFAGKRRVRLTKAALEALAIIAYKQPTTRPEVDAIRGVASGGVMETLLERNLVRIAGRADSVGRPLLYATTPEFLTYLGLDALRDLPSLDELETMLAQREEEARREEEEELRSLAAAPPPAAAIEPGEPAAVLESKLRQSDLPTLDDLDAELRRHGETLESLSARVEVERRRQRGDDAPGAAAPDAAAGAATEAAATEPDEHLPGGS